MKQYLFLLRNVYRHGDAKPAAREGLPGTRALFGPQIEFDLTDGFPIVTTKETNFHNIVVELLWFLRGKPNITYLVDNGVNIWNEDAYNYFKMKFPESKATFKEFVERVKGHYVRNNTDYHYGDVGNQYPKTWMDFGGNDLSSTGVNQITRVLQGLANNPFGRRHLVSSVDVANDQDLALYWCHSLFQFNCRELDESERVKWLGISQPETVGTRRMQTITEWLDNMGAPFYALDCKMYQRSADVIVGVPYNISSYSLLTYIFCSILNMMPGRYIHTFGDVHLYDNHQEAALMQLARTPKALPTLSFSSEYCDLLIELHNGVIGLDDFFMNLKPDMFTLNDYESDTKIKATLNTGMKDGSK